MLQDIGVTQVRLMTNNPAKIEGLESNGVQVVEQVTIASCPHESNIHYLNTKRDRMGHTF